MYNNYEISVKFIDDNILNPLKLSIGFLMFYVSKKMLDKTF